jgi:tripartite-type tricarboxylate transporter receptor subunit TctC
LLISTPLLAQTFPTKTIRFVVPFAAGGSNDVSARAVNDRLAAVLGQPVILDNRPGAGGITGMDHVAKSAPDGHTILVVSTAFSTLPAVQKLPFDPIADFAPVAFIGRSAMALVVHPSMPAKSVRQLVDLARARPGEINYATAGIGGTNHFATELFASLAKIQLTHVPYKGNAPALTDVMGGHVQMMISSAVGALQHVRSGRLRVLAVSSAERLPFAPELPTIAEAGVPGYSADIWWGLVAPRKTPAPVVQRLHEEVVKIIQIAEVRERLGREGAVTQPMSADAFAALIAADVAKWKKVAAASGIKAE